MIYGAWRGGPSPCPVGVAFRRAETKYRQLWIALVLLPKTVAAQACFRRRRSFHAINVAVPGPISRNWWKSSSSRARAHW